MGWMVFAFYFPIMYSGFQSGGEAMATNEFKAYQIHLKSWLEFVQKEIAKQGATSEHLEVLIKDLERTTND